jgi:5-methylcytosine-specific restriction endonuclease McrA
MKHCNGCDTDRLLEDFTRDRTKRDGRCTRCKFCTRRRSAEWKKANPHWHAQWRKANREAVNAQKIAWAEANPDKIRAWRRRWYAANKTRAIKKAQIYYATHRDAVLRRTAATRSDYRKARLGQFAEYSRKRYALKRAGAVDFTQAQLEQRLSMFVGCWMCGGPFEDVDHVKPLSKGGLHCLANLRPACKRCNQRKANRWPLEEIA